MIIAIDFDGTIVDYDYPFIGEPVPGAIEWMKRFIELEAKIILHTMRSSDKLSEAKHYLYKKGISGLYGYNYNPTQYFWTTSPKVHADLYIDDSAFGCPTIKIKGFNRKCVDWSNIGPKIEKLILNSQHENI